MQVPRKTYKASGKAFPRQQSRADNSQRLVVALGNSATDEQAIPGIGQFKPEPPSSPSRVVRVCRPPILASALTA